MKIMLFEQFINEKISHVNFDDFAEKVAIAYEFAPVFDKSVIRYWDALNKSNHKLYKQIKSKCAIEFVNIDPYSTAEEMRNDVKTTGILKIYNGSNNHPYFSKEDNLIFRTVHDYYTHIITKTENFDLRGEIRAYNTHSKLVPPIALPALFTELIGQVCFYLKRGEFPKQKVAVLHGFDFKNVGIYQ